VAVDSRGSAVLTLFFGTRVLWHPSRQSPNHQFFTILGKVLKVKNHLPNYQNC